jgi:uncharacterized membrane protein YeaQ/YmgE (transglycosylase-associated protein family)
MQNFISNMVWFLLLGLLAGWLAGKLMKGAGFGLLGNLVVGVIGAMLGGFLFDVVGLSTTTKLGALLMATAGAVVFLLLLNWLSKVTRSG